MSCDHRWYVYFVEKVAREGSAPKPGQINEIQNISICDRCKAVMFYCPEDDLIYYGETEGR